MGRDRSECCGGTHGDCEEAAHPAVAEAPGQGHVASIAPAGAPAVLDPPRQRAVRLLQ